MFGIIPGIDCAKPIPGLNETSFVDDGAQPDIADADKILDNVTHGVTFSLDVFEHMEVDQLNSLMQQLQSRAIVIRVPVCRNAGEDYVLECSRADATHVIRWTKNQWREFFSGFGYVTLDLNLHTIYNSDGVFSAVAVDPSYLKHEFMS